MYYLYYYHNLFVSVYIYIFIRCSCDHYSILFIPPGVDNDVVDDSDRDIHFSMYGKEV